MYISLDQIKNKVMDKFYLEASTSPVTQKAVIDFCNSLGICVFEDTCDFDPNYPVLGWDGDQIMQYRRTDDDGPTLPLGQFIETVARLISSTKMKVGEYEAIVQADKVKVGCQTIPFEQVKQVYDKMVELRSKK